MSAATTDPQPTSVVRRMLRPGVTLILLVALTAITFEVFPPTLEDGRLAILLGLVLLAASVSGSMAGAVGLPRLTGFIVIGILLGPSVLGIVPEQAVDDLRLIDLFALALIALLAGGEFKVEALRPHARSVVGATLTITLVVTVGVAAALLAVSPFVPFLAELPWPGRIAVGLLMGIWAANSSPDLTVAVIEERHATGPLPEVVLGITIVKDVLVIVLFTLALALVTPLLDPESSFSSAALSTLAWEIGGALVLGAALGWAFSQYLGGEGTDPRSPFATFLFAYVMVVLVEELHFELLLTGVTAGFVIENLSEAGDRMIAGIRSVAVVVFAFFFTIAGAGLDLAAAARFAGVAIFLFLVRLALTRAAARRALTRAGAEDLVIDRTWQGLISQGGVSLGLMLLIERTFPSIGADVVALAMAVILGNILLGPVLLSKALSAQSKPGDPTAPTQQARPS